jgi:Bacterial regulatory proteins, luxR family
MAPDSTAARCRPSEACSPGDSPSGSLRRAGDLFPAVFEEERRRLATVAAPVGTEGRSRVALPRGCRAFFDEALDPAVQQIVFFDPPGVLDELDLQADTRSVAVGLGARQREHTNRAGSSPKTVEVHLSGIYRKLGISSRTQLAAALAEPHLANGLHLGGWAGRSLGVGSGGVPDAPPASLEHDRLMSRLRPFCSRAMTGHRKHRTSRHVGIQALPEWPPRPTVCSPPWTSARTRSASPHHCARTIAESCSASTSATS